MRNTKLIAAAIVAASVTVGCQASEASTAATTEARTDGSSANNAIPETDSVANSASIPATQNTIDGVDRPIRSDELRERADNSFSDFALGDRMPQVRTPGWTLQNAPCGSNGVECTWINGDGVIHVFTDANILFVKRVNASDFGTRAIAALGIGTARDRATVLRNVSAHLLGMTTLNCHEAGDAGEAEGISACDAAVGESWIKLSFNEQDQLVSAQIDAFQPN